MMGVRMRRAMDLRGLGREEGMEALGRVVGFVANDWEEGRREVSWQFFVNGSAGVGPGDRADTYASGLDGAGCAKARGESGAGGEMDTEGGSRSEHIANGSGHARSWDAGGRPGKRLGMA